MAATQLDFGERLDVKKDMAVNLDLARLNDGFATSPIGSANNLSLGHLLSH
jgi:hypothetical protein